MVACELPRPVLSASASCHASFGELLQGALPDERRFLVTLPIELQARAQFSVPEHLRGLHVVPESSWKTLGLLHALMLRHGLPLHGELRLESEIERGKGLASSTADLVAAYRAVTSFYGLPQRTDELEELLRAIEPSDGLMHPGVVAYLHREARLLEHLGPVPAVTLIAIDEGGAVDTLAQHRQPLEYSVAERDEFAGLLEKLRQAFARGATSSEALSHEDHSREALSHEAVAAIGAVATRSAQLNQRLLPKRSLGAMIDIAASVGAAGVVVAHSGTYVGIIVDARRAESRRQVSSAVSRLRAQGFAPRLLHSVSSQASTESSRV